MDNHILKERFDERKKDFTDCVDRLQEAIDQPVNSFLRDSVIKRYECAWETCWKMLKLWLSYQGIMTTSPREVWKEAFAAEMLDGDADIWAQAQRMRNLTVHTYDEAVAEEVHQFIRDHAIAVFQSIKNKAQSWTIDA